MNKTNLDKKDENEYLRIEGIFTITKTSGLTTEEFEEKLIKFVEENKCYFGGVTCKIDSEGNEID